MHFNNNFCEKIHEAGLVLLEKIGIKIDHPEVLALVLKAGAKPGPINGSAVFPRQLVKEQLGLAPPQAKYSDLEFNVTALKAGGPCTFWTPAALNIRDDKGVRPFTAHDLACLARVVDNLKNVYGVTGTSMSDVAAPERDFIGFRVMAQNTKKHIRPLMFTKTGVQPIMEMARVLLDNRKLEEYPIFSLGYSILSPFHWAEIPVSMWYLSSGYKIPVMINGEPIAGATSPMTLAGSVAQSNAEILSGIIINQIIEPGRPCIYNLGFAHALDMKTTLCLSGSPECALMAAAGAHMAIFYNLPSASWMSTDSIYGTYQAAAEKMMTGLIHAQQGINLIWGVGQLESQKTLSLMQCVLDNDLAGYINHFIRGFETNDDTIALDEILKQGYEGKYIESDHTFNHFRDTLYFPETFTREYYNAKAETKEQNADDIAREKVNHILNEDTPVYLRTDQERELLRIENAWMQRAAA